MNNLFNLNEKLSSNEGADKKLARKYGLDNNQIEALGGMRSIVPRSTMWRFRKKSAEQIRISVERYSNAYLAATQLFVDALFSRKGLDEANVQLAKLTRLAIEKDLEIEEELAVRNPFPPTQHPDNSTL